MKDRQIQCFLEAARELNFTRAAENLFLPQPAVSRYISALEKELGTVLFVRENNRNVCLSDDGKIYYNMFQRFSMEFESTKEMLSTSVRPLRFGYNIGWNISSFLPQVISHCKDEHPEFQISIECLGFHDLIQALNQDHLDAILTLENYPEFFPAITQKHITSVRRLILYSDKLYSPKEISSPADFYACNFFVPGDQHIDQILPSLQETLAPYHFIPRFQIAGNMETLIASVENGLGVAMLDEWGQNIKNPGMHTVNLDATHPVSLAWRRNSNHSAIHILKNALIDYL